MRAAGPAEWSQLRSLEAAADRRFADLQMAVGPPAEESELAAHDQVLVLGTPAVGAAMLDLLDGHAYLAQLAVHPDHGRRGLGRALVEASCAWAAGRGSDSLTLITYRDVPFNGPFYRSAGFVEVPVLTWLTGRWAEEGRRGRRRAGTRVVMARPLPRPAGGSGSNR